MFRHRPPPSPTIPPTEIDWPDWAEGPIYWARQNCLIFGRDRREPTESRPVLAVTQRDQAWVVLPATTKDNAAHPHFFHVPADSPDCVLAHPGERPDQYFYRGYERIDLTECGARKYGLLHHRLRLDIMRWLRASFGIAETGR